MNKIMKIVAINSIVFIVMIIAISASIFIYSYYSGAKDTRKARLPNYDGVEWAETHFLEFKQLKTLYYDYIIWRRQAFSGETINIDQDGVRRTVNGERTDRTAFFFGGSTMWGTGADDANTIPSIFASNSQFQAFNFGEAGWNAHQSLNQLMKLYIEGHRPDLVVFYDGYNEVGKCRSELNFYSASRESQIRQTLKYSTNSEELKYYARPIVDIYDEIKGFFSKIPHENCHLKPDKAKLITTALIQDWQMAKSIVDGYCGRFVAILQPNAYVGAPRLDHLPEIKNDKDQRRPQISAVYPIIRQEMAARSVGHDFTDAFDGEQYLYIDSVHVSPAGNARIAARLSDLLASMELNGLAANSTCQGNGPAGKI